MLFYGWKSELKLDEEPQNFSNKKIAIYKQQPSLAKNFFKFRCSKIDTIYTLWRPISHLRLVQYFTPDVRGVELRPSHITLNSAYDWSISITCLEDKALIGEALWSRAKSLAIFFHLITFVLVSMVELFLFPWWEDDFICICRGIVAMWNKNLVNAILIGSDSCFRTLLHSLCS